MALHSYLHSIYWLFLHSNNLTNLVPFTTRFSSRSSQKTHLDLEASSRVDFKGLTRVDDVWVMGRLKEKKIRRAESVA